jgi:hypothetical protein
MKQLLRVSMVIDSGGVQLEEGKNYPYFALSGKWVNFDG